MIDAAAHIDFETGSRTDLVKSGVYRYAEDPATRVFGFSYKFDDDDGIYQWRPGAPDPIRLLNHIAAGGRIVAHNAGFERRIWNVVLPNNHGVTHWPRIQIWQQDCTMARAAAIAHPQQLEKLAGALGLEQHKDAEGAALMMKMCRPRRFNPDGSIEWWDSAENVDRLMKYCDQDIRTEDEADHKLPPLTEGERRVWMFDQVVNDRGVNIDIAAAERCADLVEYSKKQADRTMRELTGRTVPKCSNDGKLIAWVQSRGIECTTVKKAAQDDIMFFGGLNNDPLVKDVIELRRASKKTSTAKYASMLKCASADGRIRGLLNYHGASTGRWAGRLVQPQNFPRLDFEEEGHIILWLHELLNDRALSTPQIYELITAVHGSISPLLILSRALRSMIRAPEGKKLVGGDFSNIEGRVNAWMAGEHWKLQAFRDYDTITGRDAKGKITRAGPDLYKKAAAGIFGKKIEDVTAFERQSAGKVSELALGFQGSIGAFITMGENYGLSPYDLTGPVRDATSLRQWDMTAEVYQRKGTNRYGLQENEWVAIKVIVDNWRKTNPAIVQSWWDYQDAAVAAVDAPGQVVAVCNGKAHYYSDGRCLWCVLPSGRMLCYSAPELIVEKQKAIGKDGREYDRYKKTVMFWGTDSKTKQWKQRALYGGLQCENIVQAAARDVMCDRMFAAEKEGFPLILTVHDELLTEPDEHSHYHTAEKLQQIMSVVPKGFEGLPLAAAAWEDTRYVK